MGVNASRSCCRERHGLRRPIVSALAALATWAATPSWLGAAPDTSRAGAGSGAAAAVAAVADEAEPLVVAVVLNAVLVADAVVAHAAAGGGWWLPAAQLARWRLRADDTPRRDFDGVTHQRVCAPGARLRCQLDDAEALLRIEAATGQVSPLRFGLDTTAPATVGDPRPEAAAATNADPGGGQRGAYANYDLLLGHGAGLSAAAQMDARAFFGGGELYLQAGLALSGGSGGLYNRAWGWQRDDPARGWVYTAGGFAAHSAAPVSGLPLWGLRWASQRSLQPDRIWLQRPLASGEVVRSARAELFVDGQYRRSAEVPYGPFEIETDALRAGAGQMQLVTTDDRGQRQVRTLDYYVAPQLLPAGSSEHALELGAVSGVIGRPGPQGPLLLAGHYRRGWNASTTVEVQGLLARRAAQLAVSVDRGLGNAGVLRGGMSVIDRGHGLRPRLQLAHEYLSDRWSSFVSLEGGPRERDWQPLASSTAARDLRRLVTVDRRRASASLLFTASSAHQLSASISDRVDAGGNRQRSAALNLTWQAPSRLQVMAGVQVLHSLPASTQLPAQRLNQAVLTLVWPLSGRQLVTVSARAGGSRPAAQWTLQSVPDPSAVSEADPPPMYRVYGELGRQSWAGAAAWQDTRYGQWLLEATSGPGKPQARARFSGAAGWLGGSAFAAPRLDDSFVIVDTDGHAGVPVYLENRPAGVTGANGRLLVAGARAWQNNRISLDSAALPIDATLTRDQLDVRPRGRAGALARFEIGDGGELVAVQTADGSPVPAGARAVVSSQVEPAVVGSSGELFVSRAGRRADVQVVWPGGRCRFDYVPAGQAGAPPAGEAFRCR